MSVFVDTEIYYVASEDIFSNGFVSELIRKLVAPIPIAKGTNDAGSILKCIRVAREGGTIAMAPEGNRTYSGRTEHMAEAVVPLARKLGLPIALYRIEGGYGKNPRWSDKVRRGKMRAYVYGVITPEEYGAMTDAEMFDRIKEGLYVDENRDTGVYRSNRRAEYIERAVYVCPFCGLSEFRSKGNFVTCEKCGRKIEYCKDKKLKGVGFDFPFEYFGQWYDFQNEFVLGLDPSRYTEAPLYTDKVDIYEVELYKRKKPFMKGAELSLYGDRAVVNGKGAEPLVIPFSAVTSAAVLGRNKLNIYEGGTVYQIKGGKRFNALKYMNFYYLYINKEKDSENGKFLGL